MSVDRFRHLCRRVREVLDSVPAPDVALHAPVGDHLQARGSQQPQLDVADEMLTSALDEYPLHPYLLDWRAEVRMRMIDGDANFVAKQAASADLELAMQVAPDYLLPQLRHADLTYVQFDDPRKAAALYAATLEKMESFICSCVAGHVEALNDDEKTSEARALLARWQLVYPDNRRLQAAAEYLGLTTGES
jgi:hypothetical protein